MKKSIMLFSFILALVLMCGLVFTNSSFTNKNVYAKTVDNGHIIVVGKGEVEAKPDTVRVSFSLKCRAETLQQGQVKMRETIKAVTDKITDYNKNAEVYTNYSSSYPVFENGLLAYEFDSCLIAKSPDVEDVNGLVDAIVEAGATSVHSVNYVLSNKDEAYILALKQAKDNAQEKANAIYENVTLKGLKEEAVYNYCEGNQNEKIKITAKVTAFYQVNSGSNNEAIVTNNALTQNASNEKLNTTSFKTSETLTKKDKQNKKQTVVETSENLNNETKETEKQENKEINNLQSSKESVEAKQTNSIKNNEVKTNSESVETNKVTENKTAETTKNIVKETQKTSEPLSIIDANGNVVLEII